MIFKAKNSGEIYYYDNVATDTDKQVKKPIKWHINFKAMSYEAGSPECRKIIDAKENLLKIMQSLNNLENVDSIQFKLKDQV